MTKKSTLGINSSAPYCHHHEAVWAGATILLAKLMVLAANTNRQRPLEIANRMAKAGGALGVWAVGDDVADAEVRPLAGGGGL
jgi:hypothetical protein